jgi:hypothetical protein
MEKDIGKITKNDTTEIVLRIDDFGGRRGFTVREFVTSERYTGFTKSGVRILAKDFPKFKEMINSVSEEEMKEEPQEGETQETLDKPEEPKEEASKEETPKEEMPDY